MIDFWVTEEGYRTLDFVYKGIMRPYLQTYLTGEMDDPSSLKRIGDFFTLARWMLKQPDGTKQEYDFAHVESAALYPGGVIFTPFKAHGVEIDHRRQLMHMKERIELLGSDGDDFPSRLFKTHIGSFKTREAKDRLAFLYRSGVEMFIVEVPGSFNIEDLDGLLSSEGVLSGEGVAGSKYMGVQSLRERRLAFTNWEQHIDESREKLPGFIESFIDEKT